MELAFYASALVAIYSTLRVISTSNPMHALLNLIISLIAAFVTAIAAFAAASIANTAITCHQHQ